VLHVLLFIWLLCTLPGLLIRVENRGGILIDQEFPSGPWVLRVGCVAPWDLIALIRCGVDLSAYESFAVSGVRERIPCTRGSIHQLLLPSDTYHSLSGKV
jgi:hypothetical protein